MRKGILVLVTLFLILSVSQTGKADEFPSRPVDVVISFAPGGSLDLAVRVMGEDLSKALGVPAMLSNKGGAGGAVGTEYVRSARPDGYTVLAAPIIVFTILPLLSPGLNYKLSDFIPLCQFATSPNLVLVKKGSPFKTFQELISYAKKNPGKLNCASAGTGTATHFNLEMIKIQAGIEVGHLPFKSGGEANTSLMGGQVDFALNGFPPSVGLLKSGDLVALASTLGKVPGLQNIPTMEEVGYPKASLGFVCGYYLPKGTPQPIVDKLASVFEKAMKGPNIEKNLENSGLTLDYRPGPAFGNAIIQEFKTLEEVAKKAKLIQ